MKNSSLLLVTNTSFYHQIRLYQHYVVGLLSFFVTTRDPIVIYYLHHVATQDPGHSTKFVTLPSPVLL